MENRFFVEKDKSLSKVLFDLDPDFWWSRRFEYAWCLDVIKEDDVILDVACGTYHPFKFKASEYAKKVCACDVDNLDKDFIIKEIKNRFNLDSFDLSLFDRVELSQRDIRDLQYKDKMFDKVFCISSLEHMDNETIRFGLKEMKRVLKDDGNIFLTLDYPTKSPEEILKLVGEVDLSVKGEINYNIPNDAIFSTYFGGELKCYSMVLVK